MRPLCFSVPTLAHGPGRGDGQDSARQVPDGLGKDVKRKAHRWQQRERPPATAASVGNRYAGNGAF